MAITFNLVPSTAAASAVYVEQEAVSRGGASPQIPHKILVMGQYNSGFSPTVNTPQLILNKADAWTRYGRGSLLSAMIEKALSKGGGSPVYALPLADDGSAVAATGTLAVSVTTALAGTLAVYVGGVRIPVAVTAGMTDTQIGDAIAAAVNAKLDLPVTAANVTGTVTFTVRWKGEAGNQIQLELNRLDTDETPGGVTVVTTDIGDVVAGATNPVLTTALAAMGDTWFTELVNPYLDATSLTAIESAGVDRADPAVMKMFTHFVGYTDTIANFITALGSRNSEWTNYVPVPGSPTPAYMIAAATGAIFARYQQSTPGRPMKTLTIPDVIAGNESMIPYNDTVVVAGGSWTINNEDDTVKIGDLCTTRTTEASGAETTDWRFTIIIPNLQYKIYAALNTFLASPFDRAVVLADGSGRGPTYGVRPSTVKAYGIKLVDDWIERGLSTNRDLIVNGDGTGEYPGISAEINSVNPGRIDLLIPDIPSAGLRILAAKIDWAFITG